MAGGGSSPTFGGTISRKISHGQSDLSSHRASSATFSRSGTDKNTIIYVLTGLGILNIIIIKLRYDKSVTIIYKGIMYFMDVMTWYGIISGSSSPVSPLDGRISLFSSKMKNVRMPNTYLKPIL